MDYLITDLKAYIGTAILGVRAYKAITCLIILLALINMVFSREKILKRIIIFILTLYMYFVFSTTVIIRPVTEGDHLMLIPFWSYMSLNEMKFDIVENILLFVPAGALAGFIYAEKRRVFLVGAYFCVFSASIEIMQYLLKVGLCEFDDIFHNTLGSIAGYIIVFYIYKYVKEKESSDE